MLRKTWALMRRLDDHWIGDLIGAAAIILLLLEFLFLAEVFK